MKATKQKGGNRMARLKCPCCGKPYNGKKCDECLYEAFGDVEVHNHAHGTYGVPASQTWGADIPEKKPVVVSAPRQTNRRRSANSGKRLLPIFLIPIICIVLSLLFELVVGIFVLSDTLDGFFTEEVPAPEPPAECFTLYQEDDITIFTPWQPNTPIEDDLPLYVENSNDRDVVIRSSMAAVNGIMAEDVFFYCEVEEDSVGSGLLWIDLDGLDTKTVGELILHLEICDADTYELMADGIPLAMYTGQLAETGSRSTEGTLLLDREGILLVYQGWQINALGEVEFSFYGQNSTDRSLYVTSDEILADGEPTDLYLWTQLLPHTRGWFSVTTAELFKLGAEDPSEIGKLSFLLYVNDYYNWDSFHFTQTAEIACNP